MNSEEIKQGHEPDKAQAETEFGASTNTGTDTDANTETNANADSSTGADTGTNPDTGADTDTGADSDAQSQDMTDQGEKERAAQAEEAVKKGLFGRKKDKKDPKDVQIEELNDRVKRTMAEFDNYRKRTEKEKSAMYEIGAKDVIEKILPVVDNFERGLNSIPQEAKGSPFAEGMEKIYKQLMKTLEDLGVKPIDAVGKPFDPNFHNAVMHVEDESLGENVVSQELQKGYMYRDSVVRHSMVQVAN